jgi:Lrp/AsnC family transcriptional regulator, leucine-responsive regulatory protein
MDPIDAHLLDLLQQDCSRSLAELGKEVNLSISAVKLRLEKLRARGEVRAYVALISPDRLGYTICAFVQVLVDGKKNERHFLKSVLKMPEIEECHRVSGEFPYLLKLWARGLPDLERVLDEKIKTRPGVVGVRTSIVLSSPKDQVTGLAAREA